MVEKHEKGKCDASLGSFHFSSSVDYQETSAGLWVMTLNTSVMDSNISFRLLAKFYNFTDQAGKGKVTLSRAP